MKQSQYLKIFRMTWLFIGIGFILLFGKIHFEIGIILVVGAFLISGIFAIIRLEYDDNYIDDTNGQLI